MQKNINFFLDHTLLFDICLLQVEGLTLEEMQAYLKGEPLAKLMAEGPASAAAGTLQVNLRVKK